MPLPAGDLLLARVGGSLPSDKWSVGLWFDLAGLGADPTPAQMNAACLAWLTNFANVFWTPASNPWKSQASVGVSLATGTLYLYRSAALTASGTATISTSSGTGSNPLPSYVARVCTLLTNNPGRSKRGRIYLPANGVSPNSGTGLWSSVQPQVTNLGTAIQNAEVTGFWFGGSEQAACDVVSKTHGIKTRVTSLRMDNKPDTQRGRENKLTATVFDSQTI